MKRKRCLLEEDALRKCFEQRDGLYTKISHMQQDLIESSGGYKENLDLTCRVLYNCMSNPNDYVAVEIFIENKEFQKLINDILRTDSCDLNRRDVRVSLGKYINNKSEELDQSIFYGLRTKEALLILDQILLELMLIELKHYETNL